MNETISTYFSFIGYGILIWGIISDSIARVIGAIGLLFLIAIIKKEMAR